MATEENKKETAKKEPSKKFTVLSAFSTDKKEYKKGDHFFHSNEKVIANLKQKKHI